MRFIKNSYFFNSGRSALIWFLLNQVDYRNKNAILVPDFICNSITDPLVVHGFDIFFFKVDSNLKPCLDSILKNLESIDSIKYLLLINYFGIPSNFEKISKICKQFNKILIEDNAHGFGGFSGKKFTGTFGDVSISSPKKLNKNAVGGILTINNNLLLKGDSSIIDISQVPFTRAENIYFQKYNGFKNKLRSLRLLASNPDNPYNFRENKKIDYYSNFMSNDFNFKEDWSSTKKIQRLGWQYAQKICFRMNLDAINKNDINDLCPWAFPILCINQKTRNKLLRYFRLRYLNVFTWPCLPDSQIKTNTNAYKIWSKLLCFPINKVSINILKKLSNESTK